MKYIFPTILIAVFLVIVVELFILDSKISARSVVGNQILANTQEILTILKK